MADSIITRAKTAALVALAEHGQTTDIQEALTLGNNYVPPNALDAMIRAMIAALIEPTPEMLAAVCPVPESLIKKRADVPGYEVAMRAAALADQMTLRLRWRDMIDAALAEAA